MLGVGPAYQNLLKRAKLLTREKTFQIEYITGIS